MIRKTRSHLVILFSVALATMSFGLALADTASDEAMEESGIYRINSVQWEKGKDEYVLRIKGDSAPTFTPYELFEPLRIVLDIADGQIVDPSVFPLEPDSGPVTSVSAEILDDQEPVTARMEIILGNDSSYSVETQGYDIVVRFASTQNEESPAAGDIPAASAIIASLDGEKTDNGPDFLSEKDVSTKKLTIEDDFSFSGYGKEKVSVDFFKIDLHNVFRFIGEVSGRNIVVDEEVKGSLTLALDDVPWDFVLDVVINLKDLQKMERFKTIIILPKSKEIVWPESIGGRLAITAEDTLAVDPKEGISVKERLSVSPEEVAAKKLVREANAKLVADEYEAAFTILEKAFAIWPESSHMASRISSLCLVNLGLNAKGIYYAKQALRLDPYDVHASLQAAIGYANMQNDAEAIRYFSQATRGERPLSSALLSYASFIEKKGDNDGALALLKIHAEVHGDTVGTMVSKARLYDKMGDTMKAVTQYRAIQLSGYQLPADLKRYIEGRIAIAK